MGMRISYLNDDVLALQLILGLVFSIAQFHLNSGRAR
jgi:hypothetical protein